MLFSLQETKEKINRGELLHISGDQNLIMQLPRGNWIGGSTDRFMTQNKGGVFSEDKLYITELSSVNFKIKTYTEDDLKTISQDAYENGYSIVILPYRSKIVNSFALNIQYYKDIFLKCIVGWVSAPKLNKAGKIISNAIVINGLEREVYENKGVVLHVEIPKGKIPSIGIVNIFEPDPNSPEIEFLEEGFGAKRCLIDGKETDFVKYVQEGKINTKLPIIGNFSGSLLNVAFNTIPIEDGEVRFFCNVFKNVKYRCAKQIPDYSSSFINKLDKLKEQKPIFACNCIINYIYGDLEGKDLRSFFGPVTYGEIAYHLLNQTLVYIVLA